MALPSHRLQELIALKDGAMPRHGGYEFWHIIDGALVIFDGEFPPRWLPRELHRDDDGNTSGQLSLVAA